MYRKAAYDIAIGLTLRELHDERLIARVKVAEALEIDELAVTRIETGEERMSAGDLFLVLDLFGLTWDEFSKRVRAHLPKAEAAIT